MSHGERALVLATVVVSTLVALGAVEMALRMRGGMVPLEAVGPDPTRPVVREPDAVLGWRNRPGRYVNPPYSEDGRATVITILADGSRATSTTPERAGPRTVLVGGSFAFGEAITDEETLAWRLQAMQPNLRVENFGVGAFGTYQSLLSLERLFRSESRPAVVLYGFNQAHERRNVAPALWIQFLTRRSSRTVSLPYVTLADDRTLDRRAPLTFAPWPLRDTFAVIATLQDGIDNFASERRLAQKRRVTELLLLEMKRVCDTHDAALGIVMLQASPEGRAHYAAFLRQHGIQAVDCVIRLGGMQVRGEGHPNGEANARWAHCVDDSLGPVFERAVGTARD
jgi:hypothetical protein